MNKIYFYILIIITFYSCGLKKDVVYFKNSEPINLEFNDNSPILRKDDFVSIIVLGGDENTLKLVNFPQIQGAMRGYATGTPTNNGYLIDERGEINFPLIGKVKLEGLTRNQAINLIEEKLVSLINNPVVTLQIQNFHVTILGEIKTPGTFTIPNEKVNILELIGIAGDLTIYGVRKNILVLREENGKKKEYRIDLTKSDFINSPVFNLQQNDVVYVEPNQSKVNSSRVSSTAGIFVSVATLIITTINSFKK
jgi:polysaccharide export outer membrane protein